MPTPSDSSYRENQEPTTKICTNKDCPLSGAPQPLRNFSKNKNNKGGLECVCKTCSHTYGKKYREENKDYIEAKNKDWKEKNREYINAVRREKRNLNKDHVNEVLHNWREDNPTKAKEYYKTFRQKHPDYSKELWRKKREKHQNQRATDNKSASDTLYGTWAARAVSRIRQKCRQKGLLFDMSAVDIIDKNTGELPEVCPIFPHIRLDYRQGTDHRCWASVDRKVPELGYVKGNVWVVSNSANLWKNNGSNPAERKRIVEIMQGKKKTKLPMPDQPSLFDGL